MTCTMRVAAATDAEIAAKIAEIRSVFEIAAAGPRQDLDAGDGRGAALVGAGGVGLDRLVADFDLNGLTYYYRGLRRQRRTRNWARA